jgi:hypothetical protein
MAGKRIPGPPPRQVTTEGIAAKPAAFLETGIVMDRAG